MIKPHIYATYQNLYYHNMVDTGERVLCIPNNQKRGENMCLAFFNTRAALMVYKGMILPILEYVNPTKNNH